MDSPRAAGARPRLGPSSTRTSAVDNPEFDDAALEMIRRVGRDALATKMIDLFLVSGPERVSQILAAHATGDFTTAGRVAHSLKSSAGQLGAVGLQRTCMRI